MRRAASASCVAWQLVSQATLDADPRASARGASPDPRPHGSETDQHRGGGTHELRDPGQDLVAPGIPYPGGLGRPPPRSVPTKIRSLVPRRPLGQSARSRLGPHAPASQHLWFRRHCARSPGTGTVAPAAPWSLPGTESSLRECALKTGKFPSGPLRGAGVLL